MKFSSLDPVYRETWAIFELLRRLGYVADDIYFAHQAGVAKVILRTQDKEFCIDIAPTRMKAKEFRRMWRRIVEKLNAGGFPEAELMATWKASQANNDAGGIIAQLLTLGFQVPFIEKAKASGAVAGDTLRSLLDLVCVCGAHVSCVESAGIPGVVHSVPPCEDFSSREPAAFLRWLRETRARQSQAGLN